MNPRNAAGLEVAVVATPGLGNSAYLLAADGQAVVIDAPRDGWRIAAIAEQRGWRITHALETHVHNDYLSGARELRRSHGTAIVGPAESRYRFSYQPAAEGFNLDVGSFGVIARATPGHTPEHLAWEVQDGNGAPLALFSGGSLLIGGVGRTDLLGHGHVAELTAAQYRSMRRLAELPDDVVVYPTHGAGSFCVVGDAEGPGSASIGALRRWNPAFAAPDLDAFEAELAAGRTLYPSYYARMAPLNRRGPRLLGAAPEPHPLSPAEIRAARADGAWLIDVRDRDAFARGHVKGSLNFELTESMVSYLGWMLPFDARICLVVDDPAQEVEVATEALRIGFDHVIGHLDGGIDAWVAAGGATSRYATVSWEDMRAAAHGEGDGPARILDVRQPYEWREGAIAGSRRIFLGDLPAAVDSLERDAPWIVACRTGVRATMAASILDRAGVPVRVVTDGGVPALPPSELTPA